VVDPLNEDMVSKTAGLTGGEGVDVCFDAAGVQEAVDTGLKSVKPRGTFVNIALWGAKKVELDMTVMLFGERKYIAGS
jgi:(R,R)-butanediol dehydrogenase / meso-butanediol dehydrogenase / diacetyl reductase